MNNAQRTSNPVHAGGGERLQTDLTAASQPMPFRHLLNRGQVVSLLQLTDDQLQHLIDTQQLQPIRIVGEERFCSKDLGNLIDAYKLTAARRTR